MTQTPIHPAGRHEAIDERLRDMGVVLLRCDGAGGVVDSGPAESDWLAALLAAPLIKSAIRSAARRWADQQDPEPVEAFAGLWLVPAPATRRRRGGLGVAVFPTDRLLGTEHLASICVEAGQDVDELSSRLRGLPPVCAAEAARMSELVRLVCQAETQLQSQREGIESMGQHLAESYEEISLLYTVIQSMQAGQHPARFISNICEELLRTLPYQWIGVLLAEDESRLHRLAGRLITAGETAATAGELSPAMRKLMLAAEPDTPIIVEPAANPDHADYRPLGGIAIGHAVASEGRVIGMLVAGVKHGDDSAVSSSEMKLLGATASHMAIFLENAALYEDLNAMYLGTLEALTAAIDAKDRYTSGHSLRVAHLTRQLAAAMKAGEQTIERVHIAGLVHDVGKIGVPEHVLLKPGRLTDEEFDWIKRHPEIGHRILKDIPKLEDALPGVLHHHERWDGGGYPHGLRGDQIPQVARMIALADAFDAMSSTRTYRPALSRDQVLDEIRANAGMQFDPELAAVFVELDFSQYDRMVAGHRSGGEVATSDRKGAAA